MKRLMSISISVILAASALLCGCSDEKKPETSQVSYTAEVQEATETTVKTTGGKIHIEDGTLGDIWITELDGVRKNSLDNSAFTADNTFKYYSENGKAASKEGIDVSSYSGSIDWKKVKSSGVDFVMVRLGGRGYGESGEMYPDEKALDYIQGARNEGIKVGAYFFSQAVSIDEAVEEANFCHELLGDIKLDYPLAYDWEIIKNDDARTDKVTATEATECARAFCEAVKSFGYIPMIYSPSRELYFKYDLTRLADYEIWYCEYSEVPVFYYQFSMWQYSSTGKVDGIEGSVDLNIAFSNVSDYAK